MPWWAWLLLWAASMVFLLSFLKAASPPTADEIDELIADLRRRGVLEPEGFADEVRHRVEY